MSISKQTISKLELIQISKLILIVFIIFIILTFIIKYNTREKFNNNPSTTQPDKNDKNNTPIDRTKLYGSLFLDNLDEVIKNMSNPDIKYETKRIELNNYSDILL
jgi:hypothetical protein